MQVKFDFARPPRPEKALPENFWKPQGEARGKIQRIRQHLTELRAQDEYQAWLAMRDLCRRDIYYLAHQVLGYQDLYEPLHDDLCRFLAWVENERRHTLLLMARGHFKSTLATVTRAVWWIINDRDTSIGLFSGDLKNARKFAREIKTTLETNERLQHLFPDIFWKDPRRDAYKAGTVWNQEEFTVRRSPAAATKKEGTVKIFGLLQAIPTGDHYDKLLGDDVVDEDIVATEGQIEKINRQLGLVVPLLKRPDQPIHYVGTRYHKLDPYGAMRENPSVLVYERAAMEGEGKQRRVIFPGWFTPEILEEIRVRKMGNYLYNCQYMMEPGDPADKRFRLEWIRSFDPWPPPKENQPYYTIVIVVDPANKQKKDSDFTAITVWALDWKWNFHLLDGVHDKMNPYQRIEEVFRLQKLWNAPVAVYETIAFQDTDRFWIERQMPERGQYFTIYEVGHRKLSKFDYILGTQPLFQSGRIYFPNRPIIYKRYWEAPDDGYPREIDIVEIFKKQLDLFPDTTHDDLIDTLALLRDRVDAGVMPKPADPPPRSGAFEMGALRRRRRPKGAEDDEYDYRAH